MKNFWFLFYNLVITPLFLLGFAIGSLFNKKIKTGYLARKNQKNTLQKTLGKVAKNRSIILVHCSSAGEWEQAVPIIQGLKVLNPYLYIAVSFFSPSGFSFAKNPEYIDYKLYLPLDGYFTMKSFLRIMHPELIIISAYDVWPNMLFASKKMNIPVIITAAILSAKSNRNKGLTRYFNLHVYKNLDRIFAISQEDKNRFLDIYPYPEKIVVTGDTRFDQVYKKAQKVKLSAPVKIYKIPASPGQLVFIAGSIWPADEKHLMPAIINTLKKYPNLKAILVPHELHEQHLTRIEAILKDHNIDSERYTSFNEHGGTLSRVAIINTIGILAHLYKQTDFAYVGGSFSTGVHNVMEPSVFGQPVFFGPNYQNSSEAIQLVNIGSAFSVSSNKEMELLFDSFITNESFRIEAGKKALELIESNLGAGQKILQNLKEKYNFISP